MNLQDQILEKMGKGLYWARVKKKLHRGAAAKEIGITVDTLRKVETGKGMPNDIVVGKLKKFYPGVLDDLI